MGDVEVDASRCASAAASDITCSFANNCNVSNDTINSEALLALTVTASGRGGNLDCVREMFRERCNLLYHDVLDLFHDDSDTADNDTGCGESICTPRDLCTPPSNCAADADSGAVVPTGQWEPPAADTDTVNDPCLDALNSRHRRLQAQADTLVALAPQLRDEIQFRIRTVAGCLHKVESERRRRKQGDTWRHANDAAADNEHGLAGEVRRWLSAVESILSGFEAELRAAHSRAQVDRVLNKQQALQSRIESEGRRHVAGLKSRPPCASATGSGIGSGGRGVERRWHALWLRSLELRCRAEEWTDRRTRSIDQQLAPGTYDDAAGGDTERDCSVVSLTSATGDRHVELVADGGGDKPSEKRRRLSDLHSIPPNDPEMINDEDSLVEYRDHNGKVVDCQSLPTGDGGYASCEHSMHESMVPSSLTDGNINASAQQVSAAAVPRSQSDFVLSYYKISPLDDAGCTDTETPRPPPPPIGTVDEEAPQQQQVMSDSLLVQANSDGGDTDGDGGTGAHNADHDESTELQAVLKLLGDSDQSAFLPGQQHGGAYSTLHSQVDSSDTQSNVHSLLGGHSCAGTTWHRLRHAAATGGGGDGQRVVPQACACKVCVNNSDSDDEDDEYCDGTGKDFLYGSQSRSHVSKHSVGCSPSSKLSAPVDHSTPNSVSGSLNRTSGGGGRRHRSYYATSSGRRASVHNGDGNQLQASPRVVPVRTSASDYSMVMQQSVHESPMRRLADSSYGHIGSAMTRSLCANVEQRYNMSSVSKASRSGRSRLRARRKARSEMNVQAGGGEAANVPSDPMQMAGVATSSGCSSDELSLLVTAAQPSSSAADADDRPNVTGGVLAVEQLAEQSDCNNATWEWDDYRPQPHNECGSPEAPVDATPITAFGDDYGTAWAQQSARSVTTAANQGDARSSAAYSQPFMSASELAAAAAVIDNSERQLADVKAAVGGADPAAVGEAQCASYTRQCEQNVSCLRAIVDALRPAGVGHCEPSEARDSAVAKAKHTHARATALLKDWQDTLFSLLCRASAVDGCGAAGGRLSDVLVKAEIDRLGADLRALVVCDAELDAGATADGNCAYAGGAVALDSVERAIDFFEKLSSRLCTSRRQLRNLTSALSLCDNEAANDGPRRQADVSAQDNMLELSAELRSLAACCEEALTAAHLQCAQLKQQRHCWLEWVDTKAAVELRMRRLRQELDKRHNEQKHNEGDPFATHGLQVIYADLRLCEERLSRLESACDRLLVVSPPASRRHSPQKSPGSSVSSHPVDPESQSAAGHHSCADSGLAHSAVARVHRESDGGALVFGVNGDELKCELDVLKGEMRRLSDRFSALPDAERIVACDPLNAVADKAAASTSTAGCQVHLSPEQRSRATSTKAKAKSAGGRSRWGGGRVVAVLAAFGILFALIVPQAILWYFGGDEREQNNWLRSLGPQLFYVRGPPPT